MGTLTVSWRGTIYEVAVCLGAEDCARARANWPNGVIVLETLLSPARVALHDFPASQRSALAKIVLRELGEPYREHASLSRPAAAARLASELPMRMPPRAVIEHDTIGALAKAKAPLPKSDSRTVRKVAP